MQTDDVAAPRPIELRNGGWFVIDEERGWSGPWHTKPAAQAAARLDYAEAHRLERNHIKEQEHG